LPCPTYHLLQDVYRIDANKRGKLRVLSCIYAGRDGVWYMYMRDGKIHRERDCSRWHPTELSAVLAFVRARADGQ
jgi:hypothetical protein